MTLLLTYASSYGSTQEMALNMGDDLRAAGYKVDVCPVESVTTLQGYEAVIMGSPIHCGLLARPMHLFLYQMRDQLAMQPLYLWITCMRVLEEGGYEHAQRHYIPSEIREITTLRHAEIFAGRIVPSELSWKDHSDLAHRYDGEEVMTHTNGDYRDWARFRQWTESLVIDLAFLGIRPSPLNEYACL